MPDHSLSHLTPALLRETDRAHRKARRLAEYDRHLRALQDEALEVEMWCMAAEAEGVKNAPDVEGVTP